MRVWAHDRWRIPLPPGHRFPIDKYALLREAVEAAGLARVEDSPEVSWEDVLRVHDGDLVARMRSGGLSVREERGLGLPWSPELVVRALRSCGGTLAAARDALRRGLGMALGGGTHHAGRDFARGYCVFNDVAIALARLRSEGRVRRALIVDCDVHQGDGTAQLLAGDSDVFTLSLHCVRNYPFTRIPSDLDIELASGTGDEAYLGELRAALAIALGNGPYDIAFYLAGADPWEGDRLGRLSLSRPGLRARDAHVLDTLRGAGIATCVTLAGGYAPDVRDTVEINLATVREVIARA